MSMGYGANMEWGIELEDIKKVVPDELQAFLNALDNFGITLDDVAHAFTYDEYVDELTEQQNKEVTDAWEDLRNAFLNKTMIGLELRYHDSNSQGSCYDDVDGAFFILNWSDVYQWTPEFKMLMQMDNVKPQVKYWVTYG